MPITRALAALHDAPHLNFKQAKQACHEEGQPVLYAGENRYVTLSEAIMHGGIDAGIALYRHPLSLQRWQTLPMLATLGATYLIVSDPQRCQTMPVPDEFSHGGVYALMRAGIQHPPDDEPGRLADQLARAALHFPQDSLPITDAQNVLRALAPGAAAAFLRMETDLTPVTLRRICATSVARPRAILEHLLRCGLHRST